MTGRAETATPPVTATEAATEPPPDRRSAMPAALDAIETITDETDLDDELWREAARDLDAQRPRRPVLKGLDGVARIVVLHTSLIGPSSIAKAVEALT